MSVMNYYDMLLAGLEGKQGVVVLHNKPHMAMELGNQPLFAGKKLCIIAGWPKEGFFGKKEKENPETDTELSRKYNNRRN